MEYQIGRVASEKVSTSLMTLATARLTVAWLPAALGPLLCLVFDTFRLAISSFESFFGMSLSFEGAKFAAEVAKPTTGCLLVALEAPLCMRFEDSIAGLRPRIGTVALC